MALFCAVVEKDKDSEAHKMHNVRMVGFFIRGICFFVGGNRSIYCEGINLFVVMVKKRAAHDAGRPLFILVVKDNEISRKP